MADAGKRRANRLLWLGLLLSVLGPLSNGLPFLGFPAHMVPWISLILPAVGLALVLTGFWRAFRRSEIYKGKITGSVLAIISVLLLAFSIAFFWGARRIPAQVAGAPQMGRRVPDFTLPDSTGHAISFEQLFSSTASNPAPKAVLLVFYRGYW